MSLVPWLWSYLTSLETFYQEEIGRNLGLDFGLQVHVICYRQRIQRPITSRVWFFTLNPRLLFGLMAQWAGISERYREAEMCEVTKTARDGRREWTFCNTRLKLEARHRTKQDLRREHKGNQLNRYTKDAQKSWHGKARECDVAYQYDLVIASPKWKLYT